MADPNDDEWLYGSVGDNQHTEEQEEPQDDEIDAIPSEKNANLEKAFETFDETNFEEAGDHEQLATEDSKDGNDESQEGDEDDSDDDDDINVVIGDIKAGGPSAYVKGAADSKQKQPGSKFNIEEFESVGTINGQPAFEFAIESIEDKPWRKPGADITDYFNYGFNEETWRAYCERQKRMRIHESGIGLASLTAAQNPQGQHNPSEPGIRPNINIGFKKFGGPRPPKPHVGTIDVIGAPSQNPIRPPAPRENVIQVMTADRREYSRTVVSQPQMPMQFNVPPEDFYHEEQDQFYGYEPTQDSQGWDNQGWAPSEIKELTPMNQPPPMNQMQGPPLNIPPPMMGGPQHRMPMMPPSQNNMIPSLMSQMNPMPIKQEIMDDKRGDNRRMGNRDFRDDSRRHDDRKRMRERSSSRDRDSRKSERSRDDRSSRSERDRESRYARESSSRRRSKSRDRSDRSRRSKSRDKMRSKSRDRKADDSRSSRSDKDRKRSKKEDS